MLYKRVTTETRSNSETNVKKLVKSAWFVAVGLYGW